MVCFLLLTLVLTLNVGILIDSDAVFYGNLDFDLDQVFSKEKKDGFVLISNGVKLVVVYVIHKKTLNNAKQIKA